MRSRRLVRASVVGRFLDLKNGIPSHDTFNRVFSLLEPAHFQACALDWVRAVLKPGLSAEDVLAIDGKQLCGSGNEKLKAVHMLNVWSQQHGLCLTSTAVDQRSAEPAYGKSNTPFPPVRGTGEITSVPGLLDTLSLLDLAGCIVSVDALNTQRKVADKAKQHKAEWHLNRIRQPSSKMWCGFSIMPSKTTFA